MENNILAISHVENNKVFYFGYGKRIADEIPVGTALEDWGIPNPCILLEDGKKVYGCECWWGNREKLEKKYVGFEFIKIQ